MTDTASSGHDEGIREVVGAMHNSMDRTVAFPGCSDVDVLKALVVQLKENRFKLDSMDKNGVITLTAYCGPQKAGLLLYMLVPHIELTKYGRRYQLQAAISQGPDPTLHLDLMPVMYLYNEGEITGLNQSIPERVTDDSAALDLLDSILSRMHECLLPGTTYVPPVTTWMKIRAALLFILVDPLVGYASRQYYYIPKKTKRFFNIWAGLIPEFWFLWHNIWGAFMLILLIPGILLELNIPFSYIPFAVAYRLFGLFFGDTLYFYKYGRWRGEKKSSPLSPY